MVVSVGEELVEPWFAFIPRGFRGDDTDTEFRLPCGRGDGIIEHGQLIKRPLLAAFG